MAQNVEIVKMMRRSQVTCLFEYDKRQNYFDVTSPTGKRVRVLGEKFKELDFMPTRVCILLMKSNNPDNEYKKRFNGIRAGVTVDEMKSILKAGKLVE